jgi:heat shock protein HslJ
MTPPLSPPRNSNSLVAVLAALALGACASASGSSSAQGGAELAGTAWVAERVGGLHMQNYQPPTLNFGDGQVSGELTCNSYSGRYDVYGERGINVRGLVYPRGACADTTSQSRQQYFIDILAGASTYRLTEDGKLELSTHDHRSATFRPAG